MNRSFRKYHRSLAVIASLPVLLTVLTGMGYVIFDEWFHLGRLGHFMLKLHTMDVIGLETIYPVLTGIGLIGLLITGITMTGLFRRPSEAPREDS